MVNCLYSKCQKPNQSRDFPRPNLGQNAAPFPIQNLPKMMFYIPNFLALHFGENFMKMGPKIAVTDVYIHIMM